MRNRSTYRADAALVAVHLGGVDVAVADVERRGHRLRGLRRRDLEDTESELRDGAVVVELDRRDCAHALLLGSRITPQLGGGGVSSTGAGSPLWSSVPTSVSSMPASGSAVPGSGAGLVAGGGVSTGALDGP